MAAGVGTHIKIYVIPVAGAGVGCGNLIPAGMGAGIPVGIPMSVSTSDSLKPRPLVQG